MRDITKSVVKFLKGKKLLNQFTIAGFCFLVWMIFFDKYKLSNSILLSNTIEKLENAKLDYENKLAIAIIERKELEENSEKFAREKFFMHKENEEVFIIEKTEN